MGTRGEHWVAGGPQRGSNGSTAYAMSKAGMFGFTRGLAKQVATAGVTVNAVAPCLILSTHFRETFTKPQPSLRSGVDRAQAPGYSRRRSRSGRLALFRERPFVTGATIDVNGGQYFA